MTIIEDWAHVPTQTDVQEAIDGTRGTFANFALCTPTSVLPGKRGVEEKKVPLRVRAAAPGPTSVAHEFWTGSARILGGCVTESDHDRRHGY